jgi:hypothetical protein
LELPPFADLLNSIWDAATNFFETATRDCYTA